MKIFVVEDEASIAKRLIRLVSEITEIDSGKILHFEQLEEADAYIENTPPDLLFLDLNLSGKDGFDILKELSVKKFETIIVSANTDRALEAFEYGVLDFVPKPFSKARISKALERYHATHTSEATKLNNVPVKKQGSVQLIPVESILFFKGANNYSEIHTSDGKRALSEKSLEHFTKVLPNNFKRIHRSYILDMDKASKLIRSPGSKYEIQLEDEIILPLGRKYYKEIVERYFST